MAGTLAKLFIALGFDTSDLARGAAESKSIIKSVSSDAQRETQKTEEHVSKMGSSASGVGGIFKTAVGTAMGFGAAQLGMMGVATGFGAIKGAAIDMNAQMETSTLQFTTLMGDAGKAKQHVADLFQFAKDTPYETGPVIEASRVMRTFGGEALDTKANLTLFGDAAAATNAPINDVSFWMSRMYANIQGGQPFGEAAMRMQELGVMTPKMVLELNKAQASGKSSSEVWKLASGDLTHFSGAMKAQANTWQGITSSLSDAVNIMMAQAFKPFFEGMKQTASAVLSFVSNPALTNTIQWLSGALATALQFVSGIIKNVFTVAFIVASDMIQPFVDIIKGMVSDIKTGTDIFEAIGNAVFDFARLLGASKDQASGAYVMFRTIADTLQAVFYTAVEQGRVILHAFNLAWNVVTESFRNGTAPVVAIGNGIGAFLHLLGIGGGQLDSFSSGVSGVSGAFSAAVAAFRTLAQNFIMEAMRLGNVVISHLKPLGDIFVHNIIPALGIFIAFVTPFVLQIVKLFADNVPTIVDIISTSWDIMVSIISIALDIVVTVIKIAVAVIGFIWEHFGNQIMVVIVTAFNIVKDTIQTVFNVVRDIFHIFADVLRGNWGKVWGDLVQMFKDIFGGIGHIIGDVLAGAFNIVKNLIIDVINWVIDRFNGMIHTANDVTGKIPGIGDKMHIPDIPKISTSFTPPKFHVGGMVPGLPGQDVLIMARAGETVGVPSSSYTAPNKDSSGSQSDKSVVVNQTFVGSDMKPSDVSRQLAWALKTA